MTNLLLVSYSCGVQKIRTSNELSEEHGFSITILTEHIPDSFKGELSSEVDVHYVEDKFPVSLYRPYWTYNAVKKAEEILREKKVDSMLSWHVPIASHIVALRIKQKHNIPWVAHFGDPWIGNPYADGILRKIIYSKRLEKYTVDNADVSTFPTDRMKEMYQNRYPGQKDKFRLVPNFIDTSEITDVESDPEGFEGSKMTMVHTGSFYGIRSPEPLFDSIELLSEDVRDGIEVHLIGDLGGYAEDINNRNLSDVIKAPGMVSKDEALKLSKGADILVLIDAPVQNSPFLPTKLAEYVFMRNPILGITPEEGTSADVIGETETGVVVPVDEPEEIAEAIERYLEDFKKNNLYVEPEMEEVRKYSSKEAVSEFASIISDIAVDT